MAGFTLTYGFPAPLDPRFHWQLLCLSSSFPFLGLASGSNSGLIGAHLRMKLQESVPLASQAWSILSL